MTTIIEDHVALARVAHYARMVNREIQESVAMFSDPWSDLSNLVFDFVHSGMTEGELRSFDMAFPMHCLNIRSPEVYYELLCVKSDWERRERSVKEVSKLLAREGLDMSFEAHEDIDATGILDDINLFKRDGGLPIVLNFLASLDVFSPEVANQQWQALRHVFRVYLVANDMYHADYIPARWAKALVTKTFYRDALRFLHNGQFNRVANIIKAQSEGEDFPNARDMTRSDVIETLARVSLYASQYEYTKRNLSFSKIVRM